ncbi:CHASE3 domain-containing protein [Solirubrobacter sp. CPCC 204708]|uniref:histidine kinase n=1 Tax=Solirubrobacter deserti TaxID=2282478 RepID=A0ABT4RCI1_9ACTN|nr:ATP-binding protein [Solirubrobacter deserti]MBE2315599.1 CHASE3 domain-containing protein [Solirubrobacter deserti]MDA0136238.1 ATP-binding protein [Solirubrobacter deserti]
MIRGLTARLLLAGGLAFLLCAGTFAVVLTLVHDARDASKSLQVANARTSAVNRVLSLVIDMETSLRGYVVSRDEQFLGPYRRAVAALPAAERALLAASAGDPAQTAAARELVAAGDAYRGWQQDQLERAQRDPDAAAQVIATGAGMRQVDRMRGLVGTLVSRQSEVARNEREGLDGATGRATTLALLGLLGIPLLLAAVVFLSARHVSQPLQRLARAAGRVRGGDLDTRVPEDGMSEVADVARSFNAMAASLAEAREELEQHNTELEAQRGQLAATVAELELEKARIETFHDVVSAFTSEVELDRLAPLLLAKLRTVAGARGGALYVADPIAVERGLSLYETAAIDPARLPPCFTPETVEREFLRHLLLPLATSGRPIGVITLLDPVSRDLATLQRMADAAAVALSNALALETARHQADVNRAVLETAHDAFVAVDADRRITAWTPQAAALFGYSEQQARGQLVDELLLPERWRAAYRAKHEELLATRTDTRRFELPAVHRDGSRLTIEVSVSPLKVGDTWQVNGFVRDIGGRVARERAREAQRAVGVALAEAGAGESVVPRILEALGRALHWPVAVHWVPDPLAGEQRRAAEWRDPDYGGEPLSTSVSMPITDGPGGFGSFEFWQRRRVPLDQELTDALESISKLVAEVLERRRAETETERLKNEFFALVSHELRTPLTSILGYLELILEEEAGEVPQEQLKFLHVIERNARRLLRLVGDLLFVAQVEAGTLNLDRHEVDLEAVVLEAVEAGRPRADQAGVTLTAHTEPVPALDGDRDRLFQVVDNLIANAVKFTPAGGSVSVRAGRRHGSAFIAVTDTGVGIASDEQHRLFERFYRTKAATEASVQGIGLGLSIVRAIAQGHGGEVACESEEGVGTTFTVELPIPIHEVTAR